MGKTGAAELRLVRGMIDKLDAAIDKAKRQLLPITHLPTKTKPKDDE